MVLRTMCPALQKSKVTQCLHQIYSEIGASGKKLYFCTHVLRMKKVPSRKLQMLVYLLAQAEALQLPHTASTPPV